ncbi:MAG: ATP-binding protein [Pseudomonadota bacterium]
MAQGKNIYISREIEATLKKAASQFPAVAITGPRQSGKSTLAGEIFGKTHTLVSFDDPVTRERAVSDPRLLIESSGDRIVFDEIQYVPEVLSYIKMAIDEKRAKRGRFIITGSQQFHLIKNLGDTLAGRIALLELLPFSLKEAGSVPSLKGKIKDTRKSFEHFCLRGTFPETNVHRDIDGDTWYGSYLQTYLERDVRTIYNIGVLRQFQQFLRLLAGRCSQVLNLSTYARDLGVSINTIKQWLSVLEACRMVYLLAPYYRNTGKRVTKSPKVYFLDTGLVCYLTGVKTADLLFGGPLAGPLFENFIVQETVKSFLNRGARPGLFFLRTHNGLEVDLIIESNQKLFPFEIKKTGTPGVGMAAPIERFRKVFSGLKIAHGRLLSLSSRELQLTENVSVQNMDSYLDSLRSFI